MANGEISIQLLPSFGDMERIGQVYVEDSLVLLITVSAKTYSMSWPADASFVDLEELEENLIADLMYAAYSTDIPEITKLTKSSRELEMFLDIEGTFLMRRPQV